MLHNFMRDHFTTLTIRDAHLHVIMILIASSEDLHSYNMRMRRPACEHARSGQATQSFF